MNVAITRPDGTRLRIEGERVCEEASPERCWRWQPEIVELIVHKAWHKGWKVETIHEAH